jgi:hypothetical protein
MRFTKEYRIARLNFLNDLMQDIAEQEPALVDLSDWHSNYDAIKQMELLIEKGEA